jgi:4-hydroxy-3-polyprenylbenzoate decarboxylase
MMSEPDTITLALTGASGIRYGLRLLECLVKSDKKIYLLISHAAHAVATVEEGITLPGQSTKLQQHLTEKYQAAPNQITVFADQEWTAPIASGSAAADAMVICPCSSGCLSAVAHGSSNNLIERAADVMLKERRQLILVPRETPLSEVHLENMLKLSRLSAVILPAMPGFYHQPQTIEDLVDFVVARILKQLNIPQSLVSPWGVKS